MNTRTLETLVMGSHLRHALGQGELQLYYQPQADLKSGRIIGVESLLRWKHAELGMVSPAEFIPLAEETGLIVPISEWVLRQACAQLKAWQDDGLSMQMVAVNLSPRHFTEAGLANFIARTLKETGLKGTCLELEITEGLLMKDVERAITTLHAFKSMGIQLAIDDFGTGYSSLSYLKRFPLDRLKIDRSFVRDIPADADDSAITLAVIAMAHSLRLKVIAEGVETKSQLTFLKSKSCDEMQGYYLSPPLPADKATALLRERQALAGGGRRKRGIFA
jgi:EAL domain-containing protein (putative c-di-GMP-specific phosphodiesterase class I)